MLVLHLLLLKLGQVQIAALGLPRLRGRARRRATVVAAGWRSLWRPIVTRRWALWRPVVILVVAQVIVRVPAAAWKHDCVWKDVLLPGEICQSVLNVGGYAIWCTDVLHAHVASDSVRIPSFREWFAWFATSYS